MPPDTTAAPFDPASLCQTPDHCTSRGAHGLPCLVDAMGDTLWRRTVFSSESLREARSVITSGGTIVVIFGQSPLQMIFGGLHFATGAEDNAPAETDAPAEADAPVDRDGAASVASSVTADHVGRAQVLNERAAELNARADEIAAQQDVVLSGLRSLRRLRTAAIQEREDAHRDRLQASDQLREARELRAELDAVQLEQEAMRTALLNHEARSLARVQAMEHELHDLSDQADQLDNMELVLNERVVHLDDRERQLDDREHQLALREQNLGILPAAAVDPYSWTAPSSWDQPDQFYVGTGPQSHGIFGLSSSMAALPGFAEAVYAGNPESHWRNAYPGTLPYGLTPTIESGNLDTPVGEDLDLTLPPLHAHEADGAPYASTSTASDHSDHSDSFVGVEGPASVAAYGSDDDPAACPSLSGGSAASVATIERAFAATIPPRAPTPYPSANLAPRAHARYQQPAVSSAEELEQEI
ncbi:hypothetical protein Micbo1qcDRAFT_178446 [Microdochium bolleyi]|uniref:Uncharacterized protein n=1 Tax=Microdochium bolleyi TaxID=196109 RepID=A0A136ITS2_9PEZI|nr:hypothetical protein Micbo1qcDRAFT_178446 [Microdochium bolleyi]